MCLKFEVNHLSTSLPVLIQYWNCNTYTSRNSLKCLRRLNLENFIDKLLLQKQTCRFQNKKKEIRTIKCLLEHKWKASKKKNKKHLLTKRKSDNLFSFLSTIPISTLIQQTLQSLHARQLQQLCWNSLSFVIHCRRNKFSVAFWKSNHHHDLPNASWFTVAHYSMTTQCLGMGFYFLSDFCPPCISCLWFIWKTKHKSVHYSALCQHKVSCN